jgi:hypothetical protein
VPRTSPYRIELTDDERDRLEVGAERSATGRCMARDLPRRPPDFEAVMREGAGLWWGHNAHLCSTEEFVEEKPAAGGLIEFSSRREKIETEASA